MTLQGAVNMIENEYYETRDQMISEYDYDVIHYSGELAPWKEMILCKIIVWETIIYSKPRALS